MIFDLEEAIQRESDSAVRIHIKISQHVTEVGWQHAAKECRGQVGRVGIQEEPCTKQHRVLQVQVMRRCLNDQASTTPVCVVCILSAHLVLDLLQFRLCIHCYGLSEAGAAHSICPVQISQVLVNLPLVPIRSGPQCAPLSPSASVVGLFRASSVTEISAVWEGNPTLLLEVWGLVSMGSLLTGLNCSQNSTFNVSCRCALFALMWL